MGARCLCSYAVYGCIGQRWARIRTGSGLKPILAGSGLDRTAIFFKIGESGLDRTEKIFVALMWLFWKYLNFSCDPIPQVCWMVVYILPSNAKTLLGLFYNSDCIHVCSHITLSSSSNVNTVEWLMCMPAVRLFVGFALTISFGLACTGYTFDRSAFIVLFQKVQGLGFGFMFRVYV